jgi:hypothetical protein
MDYPGTPSPVDRDDVESSVGPIRWVKRHSPRDLRRHLADPDAFLLHPVPLNPNAVERRLIRAITAGQDIRDLDLQEAQREFDESLVVTPSASAQVKRRIRAIAGPIYWKLRDIYRRAVP